jgi:hypothetical protein
MKNYVFWDMTPFGSCKNRRFAVMMEVMRSSETSVLMRATRRHIPADGILQNSHGVCLKFMKQHYSIFVLPNRVENSSHDTNLEPAHMTNCLDIQMI